jgi:hypothetical protein
MTDCQPTRTPADVGTKLSAAGDSPSDPTLYRSLTGALQYVTITRPIFPALFRKHVFICMILALYILLMSNAFFVISKALLIMVYF